VNHHPPSLFGLLVRVQRARQVPQVLAGVKDIDDLNGAREVLIGKVPDPFGPIADHDFGFGTAPTALPGFRIEVLAKLFGGFNRRDVGSRIGIADRVARLIPGGLREQACYLGLARVGRLPFGLAGPS